jgi:hypothetical protein
VGKRDDQIDALLSGGRLSGPEREQILKTVIDRTAGARWRWPRLLLASTTVLAAAAATMFVLLPRLRPEPAPEFAARGAMPATGTSIQIEVACLEGSLEACPPGATLMFAVRGDDANGFLGALARPADGGPPIWYFSDEGETPRVVSQGPEMQALARGIRIGPEHRPGRYQIDVVLSDVPLRRAELMTPPPRGVRARRLFILTVTGP